MNKQEGQPALIFFPLLLFIGLCPLEGMLFPRQLLDPFCLNVSSSAWRTGQPMAAGKAGFGFPGRFSALHTAG